jgi:DNA-directed RNA polymerase subunit RPC12/RpoP
LQEIIYQPALVGDVKCELTMLTALISLALAAGDFVGAVQCAPCHRAQYDKQRLSHHAGSLAPILKSALPEKLAGHTVRESNGLAFTYATSPNGIPVSVARAGEQSSATLEWAFGAGVQGITPVGRIGGRYFEHRVSWYPKEGRAGLTIGHRAEAPASIAGALGQAQSTETIYRCFNCHATGVKSGPDLSSMRAGIECERCHGPGKRHMEKPSAASIVNPGRLSPRAVVESCGECHRLPASGSASRAPELENPESIRFAPIGLMASRCFQASGKISCLTCHDPHEDARHDVEFYSEKCRACHTAPPTAAGSQCERAASKNCLPCHMPKSSPIPFLEFTDHRIRVAAASSPIESQIKARLLASR